MMYKCPCCGNYTLKALPEIAIAYICPVCCWENDVFIKSADEPSDENGGMTLTEAQINYRQFGAVRESFIKYTRSPTFEEKHGINDNS